MKPLPKKKRLLLQKSGIREHIRRLREMALGVITPSYPEQERGKVGVPHQRRNTDPATPKVAAKAAEHERGRKWRRKL